MKAQRIKLTTPEAFMSAFSRYESNKNHDEDKTSMRDHPINILYDVH